jgi:hypothetical protein
MNVETVIRSGGTRSAVRHGVNGFLVDPLNIENHFAENNPFIDKQKIG